MTRVAVIGLCLALVVVIAAMLVGRAIGQEIQQRVLYTVGGVTYDCVRSVAKPGELVQLEDDSSFVAKGGEVSYGDCHRVP